MSRHSLRVLNSSRAALRVRLRPAMVDLDEHPIDIARAVAERERVERQRLEKLLADLTARLEKADATPRARNAEEITPDDLRPFGLTARESEVLLWVTRGKTNNEIAIILGCGAETVKSHLKRIFRQLDVTNRVAAAAAALQPIPVAVGARVDGCRPLVRFPDQGGRRK